MGLDQSGLFFAALTSHVVSKDGTGEPWAMTPLLDVAISRIVKLFRGCPPESEGGGGDVMVHMRLTDAEGV